MKTNLHHKFQKPNENIHSFERMFFHRGEGGYSYPSPPTFFNSGGLKLKW